MTSASGTQNQTVCQSNPITETVYTFGGSATDATVTGLPAGLSSDVNTTAKTVTISGTPTESGTYTITTSGQSAPCTAATISGTITFATTLTQGNPAAGSVCSGNSFTFNLAAATGGSGAITYLWQQSSNNSSWSNADGTNTGASYTTPALTSNMYYRRQAKAATCGGTITSNAALVTVGSNSFTVSLSCSQPNPVCSGTTFTLTSSASGAVSPTYVWQQSSDNSLWGPLNVGANSFTSLNISGSVTVYYRVQVTGSTSCSGGTRITVSSNSVRVNIVTTGACN